MQYSYLCVSLYSDDDTFFPDFDSLVRMLSEHDSKRDVLIGALSESTKQVCRALPLWLDTQAKRPPPRFNNGDTSLTVECVSRHCHISLIEGQLTISNRLESTSVTA